MTNSLPYQISVIVPTLAEASRREKLLRVIDCVLNQSDVRAIPLVVINGQRFDPALRQQLERRTDITTYYLPRGNIVEALVFGVERVSTPFFSFVDDDDLYTEDALAHRLQLMSASPAPDVVVTNLYLDRGGQRSLTVPDICVYAAEPQCSILEFAWLHSSNGCFRRATIGPEDFRTIVPHMEWTSLAIHLARSKRFAFSNRPTAIYFDTPNSASKQTPHTEALVLLMASLRNQDLPAKARRLIDQKYVAGLHALAGLARESGDLKGAMRYHLRCFTVPVGWRYLSYTRKLLWSPSRP